MKHETFEDFLDREYDEEVLIRDARSDLWLAWETEWDWFAVRPRSEDDQDGPGEDRHRPVGPDLLDTLDFPIDVVGARGALKETP